MAVRFIKPGTEVRVLRLGRWRHGIAVTVTDQNTLTVRIGRQTPLPATRITGTARFTAEEE